MTKSTWTTKVKGVEKEVTAKFYTEDEVATLETAGMKKGHGDMLNKSIKLAATAEVAGGDRLILANKKKELNKALANGDVSIDDLLAAVKVNK